VARNRRKFSPEFKEEAAKMVVETSRPIAHVARELNINETTLGNWVKEYREPFPSSLCGVNLQGVDGLGELSGAPGAAAELTQDSPGLELGVRALAG
jgi:hypothetical protein